jgi:hypothetical protein
LCHAPCAAAQRLCLPTVHVLVAPPGRLQAQQREARELSKQLAGLRAETARLNALLADAAGQRSALHQQNLTLEGKLAAELKVATAASMSSLHCISLPCWLAA